MAKKKKKALLKVFGQLKQQIVWQWGENLEEDLPNVYVSEWLPQKQLLNHPNTRMMIHHGGRGSVQECWCHQVPTVR